MILVSPAIVAPFTSPKVAKDDQRGDKSYKEDEKSEPGNKRNVFTGIFSILSKFTKYVAKTIVGMIKGMGEMLNSLYRKALSAFLRSAIGIMLVMGSVLNLV